MKSAQLRAGLGKRPPGIVLEMPVVRDDIAQKCIKRPIVVDQALVQESRIPAEKDVADVEDDAAHSHFD